MHLILQLNLPLILRYTVTWSTQSSCILNISAKTTPEFQRPILNVVSISGSKERRRGYIVDIFVSALSNYGRFYGRLRLPGVVVQRYQLSYFSEGNIRLYIYNEKIKLISNQLSSFYRYLVINSDGSAWFLICTSLISQQRVFDSE
jgi:hypothetical protein